MSIHPAWETQSVLLLTEEIIIPKEYSDYADVFSKNLVAELPKRSDINEHSINLEPVPCRCFHPFLFKSQTADFAFVSITKV